MKLASLLWAFALLAPSLCLTLAQTEDDALRSRAERTNYEETSRYDDVMRMAGELKKRTDLVRTESFGKSEEGRDLPLLILANPPISQPAEAQRSGKAIVFVMANIHAGEVEGKEACFPLVRRLVSGDLRPLLDKLVILIAPIYNADGNEKISLNNRTAQNGPIGGVGTRENSKGLDLNRDFMKLESSEARSLVALFNRWDPHVTVDLHTTNGSHHGYHLTYAPSLNPDTDARLISYERDRMLAPITKAMLDKHHFRVYYYGNFSGPAPKEGENDTRTWRTFDSRPRFGNNYIGLRNRLTILSEAYSYLDFRRRIEVTAAFAEEIFKHCAAHSGEIVQLLNRADDDTIKRGLAPAIAQLGVDFEMKALPKPVDILAGEVEKRKNPRSGLDMTAMIEDKATPVPMLDYGTFDATRTAAVPHAYIFPADPGLNPIIERLQMHGIAIEELTSPLASEVDQFVIEAVNRAGRAFQGHTETRLKGSTRTVAAAFPPGSIVVKTAQPLGTLAFYLLDPESDDGFVDWNFLDSYLADGKTYPIVKLMKDVKLTTRPLRRPSNR